MKVFNLSLIINTLYCVNAFIFNNPLKVFSSIIPIVKPPKNNIIEKCENLIPINQNDPLKNIESKIFPYYKIFSSFNFNQILINRDKKLITITPGGLKGFYVLGICSYIKENYDLKNYVFSGASAGSWNSLFLSYNGKQDELIKKIFEINYEEANTIFEIEMMIKNKFISDFSEKDFDLSRVYIGSTILSKCKLKSIVYNDFTSLGDAIDCCIGSSHIPIVCGGLYYKYRNKITVDGGISLFFNQSPYLPTKIPSLIINPNLFRNDINDSETVDLCEFYRSYFDSLDIKNIGKIKSMYDLGYQNAKENKNTLDEIFI